MSDLRFGRSETNIRMVRTFAFFFRSGHNITVMFIYMYAKLIESSPERTFITKSDVDAEMTRHVQLRKIHLHSQK